MYVHVSLRESGSKMKTENINDGNISTMNFDLGFANPVLLSHNVSGEKSASQYDMHYCVEMGIVCSGSMKRIFPGYERTLHRGDAWFCGIWEPHGFSVISAPSEVLVFLIYPPFLVKTIFEGSSGNDWLKPFKVTPKSRPVPDVRKKEHIMCICRKLLDYREELSRSHLAICTMELLALLAMDWDHGKVTEAGSFRHYEVTARAIDMLFREKHFIPTGEIASRCGVSRNHFSRIFSENMGIGFAKFALGFRLNNAACDIRSSLMTLDEIAEKNGFSDDSHLCHRFTAHFGVSPMQYKRNHDGLPYKP